MVDQPVATDALAGTGYVANFAVIDVETTGLNPSDTRVIEIAIVEIDRRGRKIDEFESLVRIPGEGPLGAEFIHRVRREMLDGAPEFSDIADQVAQMLRGRIVVGHVIAFDVGYLAEEFRRAGMELPDLLSATLCTRELAQLALPPGPKSLHACCAALGIDNEAAHTALGDARATADLLTRLLATYELFDLGELSRAASAITWPIRLPLLPQLGKPRMRYLYEN